MMKKVEQYEAFINEASRRKVHKAAKQGSYPAVIVVVQDGKVIHQEPVSTPDVAPATFNVMQEKYPKALLHLEDKTGKRLFSESVVTEAKNTIGLAFKDEDDYNGFVEFIDDEGGKIFKNIGWDNKTKSWEVIMDVKVLDSIYGEGTPANKESGWYGALPGDFESVIIESVVTEGKFNGIADLVKSLHFEVDPKTAEEKKIELGKKQGEISKRKQIEGGEYSLRRFRKSINYGDGKNVDVFLPGSYDAATSTLGDGPHAKAVKKIRWTQKKYDQWLEDMAANGGAENAFDMAQNAKNEPGLIDWVKKEFRGDDALQRIQWDIEAFVESVVTEAEFTNKDEVTVKQLADLKRDIAKINKNIKVYISTHPVTKGELSIELGADHDNDDEIDQINSLLKKHTGDHRTGSMFAESVVTESEAPASLLKFMEDEIADGNDASVYLATFSGNSMEAQSTNKTWEDGVPVTKNFSRGDYKSVSPKGKIWILESERFWYFQYKGIWYAVKIADYGTPPFEY